MDELKPCPFCGGAAEIRDNFIYYLDDFKMAVCTKCGASTSDLFGTAEGAAQAWNRRVSDGEK